MIQRACMWTKMIPKNILPCLPLLFLAAILFEGSKTADKFWSLPKFLVEQFKTKGEHLTK